MANTLELHRNGAVGFSGWLDAGENAQANHCTCPQYHNKENPKKRRPLLRRVYVARLRRNHFGFWRRNNKKVAIKNPVPIRAHTSDVCPAGILPRVRRKMPIINGTTMRKIASFFILAPSGRYLASRPNENKISESVRRAMLKLI